MIPFSADPLEPEFYQTDECTYRVVLSSPMGEPIVEGDAFNPAEAEDRELKVLHKSAGKAFVISCFVLAYVLVVKLACKLV